MSDRFEEEGASTARGRNAGVQVLAVHDPSMDLAPLWMAIAGEFLFHEATSSYDALERLSGAPLACIVCVCGGSIRAQDFWDFVVRLSLEASRRIVFIGQPENLSEEFLKRTGCHWLPMPVQPEELLALVRAVSQA